MIRSWKKFAPFVAGLRLAAKDMLIRGLVLAGYMV